MELNKNQLEGNSEGFYMENTGFTGALSLPRRRLQKLLQI